MLSHHVNQCQSTCNIVIVIFPRFCNRLADCLQTGEVDAAVNLLSFRKSYLRYLCLKYLLYKILRLFPVIAFTLSKDFSDELLKLSNTTTSYPAFCNSTHVWLPIYPAPPVTKIAIIILLVLRSFINLSYGYILTHPAEIV